MIEQQHASARTLRSYRDIFWLLLAFAEQRRHCDVAMMCLQDLSAELVLAFLNYLERVRHNAIRTRNARLAAIRAFLHCAALQEADALATIRPVLAIPMKRVERPLISSLTREEIEAILAAPETTTWSGRRDRLLLLLLYNSGARVSEVIALCRRDPDLSQRTVVQLHGKGRKDRAVLLWKRTAGQLRDWLRSLPVAPSQPLRPNRFGRPISRSGVAEPLQHAIETAAVSCPSLRRRLISPHIIRHTAAMHLLPSGVDLAVIALWLGHEDVATVLA